MFSKVYDKCVYVYLKTKMNITKSYKYIKSYFLDTEDIIIYKEGIGTEHKLCSYFIVRCINYYVSFLKNIRDYYDIDADKIQIKKKYYDGEKTYILDSNKYFKNKVSIKDVINYIDNRDKNKYKNIGNYIFIKFELHNPKGSSICLKEYILKYKDLTEEFHNTIENIALFNNINSDSDAEIILSFIKDGQIKSYKIPYKNIHDKHINCFYNLGE